jgi:hypothetical protein
VHAGEDGGGQFGGELEQCGGSGLAGAYAVAAKSFAELLAADGAPG